MPVASGSSSSYTAVGTWGKANRDIDCSLSPGRISPYERGEGSHTPPSRDISLLPRTPSMVPRTCATGTLLSTHLRDARLVKTVQSWCVVRAGGRIAARPGWAGCLTTVISQCAIPCHGPRGEIGTWKIQTGVCTAGRELGAGRSSSINPWASCKRPRPWKIGCLHQRDACLLLEDGRKPQEVPVQYRSLLNYGKMVGPATAALFRKMVGPIFGRPPSSRTWLLGILARPPC